MQNKYCISQPTQCTFSAKWVYTQGIKKQQCNIKFTNCLIFHLLNFFPFNDDHIDQWTEKHFWLSIILSKYKKMTPMIWYEKNKTGLQEEIRVVKWKKTRRQAPWLGGHLWNVNFYTSLLPGKMKSTHFSEGSMLNQKRTKHAMLGIEGHYQS